MTFIEDISRALMLQTEALDEKEGQGGYYVTPTTFAKLAGLLGSPSNAVKALYGARFHRRADDIGEWVTMNRGLREFRQFIAPWDLICQIKKEWA